ncbi:CrcB family protein [Novosphingobium sp.]|uniref:CrcB family protein n=1 Tax=Novosphingobium sp. TaxID=1874826 RepID=UPI00286CEBE2|nr:CrcB family protein [Novosphingobium sp.]
MNAGTFLSQSALVAIGGAAGAWLRFAAGRMGGFGAFPWATLGINIAGSVAMGLLAGWLARYGQGGEHWRLLLGVGLLGGFTTFSAFSLELALMIERGTLAMAFVYAAVSVLAGVAGLFAGLALIRVAA